MATTMPRSQLVSDDLEARAIAWRRHLHANPELSFEEHETSAFIEQTLRSFGGLEIERPAGTAVVARLHGAPPGEGRRAPGGHRCPADPRGERDSARVDAARRDARLRARRSHGNAARSRPAAARAPRRACRRGALRLPACGGAPARRRARDRRGAACSTEPTWSPACIFSPGSRRVMSRARAGAVMAAADLFTLEIKRARRPRREPARDRRPCRRGRAGDHEPAADRLPRDRPVRLRRGVGDDPRRPEPPAT